MKEYGKKNKEIDMGVASKKKEDFGACVDEFEKKVARRRRGALLTSKACGDRGVDASRRDAACACAFFCRGRARCTRLFRA
jgi:hypothetical protein